MVFTALFAGLSCARASELPALEFSIKPRLCVLTEEEEACYDELSVKWQAQSKMHLCLYQSESNEPITCWKNASKGEHKFVLSVSQNVKFFLREPGKAWEVSEAFEVIHDHKKYRRQRRNPWSFF